MTAIPQVCVGKEGIILQENVPKVRELEGENVKVNRHGEKLIIVNYLL